MSSLEYYVAKSALWFDMSEGRGGIAYDKSGNGNHGTINGAVWAPTEMGWGVRFDGIDDYINCGSGNSLQLTGPAFSIVSIIIPGIQTSLYNPIWCPGDGQQRNYSIFCRSNNKFAADIRTDPGGYVLWSDIGSFTPGTKMMVASIHDGINWNFFTNTIKYNRAGINEPLTPTQSTYFIGYYLSGRYKNDVLFMAVLPFALTDAQYIDLYHILMGV